MIQFLVLDVDGVLTDGGMYYTESGDMMKKFNCKDGLGIIQLHKQNFPVGIISHTIFDKALRLRCTHLHIPHIYTGQQPKLQILQAWCQTLNISLQNVAYIGDDVNDLDILQAVGTSACPADAHPKVKKICTHILSHNGGAGCVREFIDQFITPH